MAVNRSPSHLANFLYGREYYKLGIVSDGANYERYPQFFHRKGKIYEGAYTKCFKTGIFRKVTRIDYNSLYPNIMIAFNFSPETVKLIKIRSHGDYKFSLKRSKGVIGVPGRYVGYVELEVRLDVDSVSRVKLKEILAKRNEIKRLAKETGDPKFESQQWALKIIANSIYGYHGMAFSRYGCVPIAIAVGALGRRLMRHTTNVVKKTAVPIECDTDGVYVYGNPKIQVAQMLTEIFPDWADLSRFTIGIEKYDGMISVDEKNYVLLKGSKLIKCGSGITGRHHPKLVDDFIDDLCLRLFKKENYEEILSGWSINKIVNRPFNDFIMSATFSKAPKLYHKTTLYYDLFVQLRRAGINPLWGDKVFYVKTTRGYKPVFLINKSDSLDYRYYQQRLASVASRLLKKPVKEISAFFQGQKTLWW